MESVNAEEFTVEAVERVSMWHTGAGWPNWLTETHVTQPFVYELTNGD